MKKLLTILILLLTVASRGYAEEMTLWEGTFTDNIQLSGNSFKAGDQLIISFTISGESGVSLGLWYDNSGEQAIPSVNSTWPWQEKDATSYTVTFTGADIEAISGHNLYIGRGNGNMNITKITLEDGLTERVLTSTSGTVENWSGGPSFPAARFANAAIGDKIVVTITELPTADYHQIALQNANGGNGDTFGGRLPAINILTVR